ncbi:MAG: hypothetical protein ACOCQ0_03255 [Desulfosalsimonas sp.]
MKLKCLIKEITGMSIFGPILAVFLIIAVPGFAQNNDKPEEIRKIPRNPSFSIEKIDNSGTDKRRFNIFGEVNFLNKERIVIDDVAHSIAPGAYISGIREDDYVGIDFNSNGKVVAVQRFEKKQEE